MLNGSVDASSKARPADRLSNPHSGLYVGGGKAAAAAAAAACPGGSLRPPPSTASNRPTDSSEFHCQSKAAESTGRTAGSLRNGGNAEHSHNKGSSHSANTAPEFGKATGPPPARVPESNGTSSASCNTWRGIGNIGGRSATKPNSSNQGLPASSKAGSSTPRNSGEFSIPSSGSVNRGSSTTPKNSGEFSTGSNGRGSNSCGSSPRTSGELGVTSRAGIAKSGTYISPKASPDSSSGSSKGGSTPRTSFEGNAGGKGSSSLASAKAARPSSGSPPRSAPSGNHGIGNLCKGNWNVSAPNCSLSTGNGRTSDSMDYSMGNILNPKHAQSGANGTLSNGANHSVGKGVASKNGGVSDPANADPLSDGLLVKQGLCCCNPEEVKNLGNELYKRGNFVDALSLYQRAIALSPGQASYRGNKAAALFGLGRLAEAVYECEEAIKLDPSYIRAHRRAASIYLRLGLVERSRLHFQAAGERSNSAELHQVEQVKRNISKCIEMRKVADWKSVIRESDAAAAAGADSAPQVLGYKAEALLKLHKPEEADSILSEVGKIEGMLTKLGIIPADPLFFMVRARVDLALGRFDDAVAAAESACRVDCTKVDASKLLRKARTVYSARIAGNEHFKAGKYFEACASYGEGLESDPLNAVLLCNRAACRSKIGQWEKALEDCNAALDVQPNYTKALMRRADCNRKLERWKDALNDYESLLKKIPDDQDVIRGMLDAQAALKKSQADDMFSMNFGGDMREVSNKDQLQQAVTFPGLVVVQFIAKWNEKCKEILPFMDGLCKRYPYVNFIKVDVEENPYLAKLERVDLVPTFRIYKNGMTMKEIMGPYQQAVEYAVQHFSL